MKNIKIKQVVQRGQVAPLKNQAIRDFILQETDKCVKCGFCLPVCPTYKMEKHEAESPRGRINAMRVLAQSTDNLTPSGIEHLTNCLQCNACTSKCPSLVNYDQLLARLPSLLGQQHKTHWAARLLQSQLGLRLLRVALRLARPLYKHRIIKQRIPPLRLLADQLVLKPAQLSHLRPPSQSLGKVALFSGCADSLLSQDAIATAATLLHKAGYTILPISDGRCCGALSRHTGRAEKARQQLSANEQYYSALNPDHILSFSSGCQAFLETEQHIKPSPFLAKTQEVIAFLQQNNVTQYLTAPTQPLRVGLYVPCSQGNLLGDKALIAFIQAWPNTDVVRLKSPYSCCGASGSHMLTHPKRAQQYLEPLVQQIAEQQPDIIVTTNIGCQMHIRSGLAQLDNPIPIMHPLEAIKHYFMSVER